MKILITGGAGFVGSNLAQMFKETFPQSAVCAFDNLKRRGSEMNLQTFKNKGIHFEHGDVRVLSDLLGIQGNFDLVIDASAEPSVHAGNTGSPDYVLQTNLNGTMNCAEFTRLRGGKLIFLSTSRVYSILPLQGILFDETPTRFALKKQQKLNGVNENGITEEFPTHKYRSFYGASKLASELILQEYAATYGLKTIINRCGVIAGRGQFGKVDQGVFTLWVANHFFQKPLKYTGFGGTGKQVRDLLHPSDLFQLLLKQIEASVWNGEIFNIGGGLEGSVSMSEYTGHCQKVTGKSVEMTALPETNPVDIPLYISNCARAQDVFRWKPSKKPLDIVEDIHEWICQNEGTLRSFFS